MGVVICSSEGCGGVQSSSCGAKDFSMAQRWEQRLVFGHIGLVPGVSAPGQSQPRACSSLGKGPFSQAMPPSFST